MKKKIHPQLEKKQISFETASNIVRTGQLPKISNELRDELMIVLGKGNDGL